jgi:hypothetical protein
MLVGQEPFYCTESESSFQWYHHQRAFSYYNSYVDKERKEISRVFSKVFSNGNTVYRREAICPSEILNPPCEAHIHESTDDKDKNSKA